MDTNLDYIAQELYGKLNARFPSLKMTDENGTALSKKQDIPKVRNFSFDFVENGQNLGTINITLDNDGMTVKTVGDLAKGNVMGLNFIKSLRQFAKDRIIGFDIQNVGRSNMDQRESAIMENKLYGTSRISYQDLGEAQLVIKHTQPINPELPAGRTMHIDSIYVENAQGERFRYPFKHINGARAMAEHIKHGGNPYDPIGKHIVGLSEELAGLRKFKNYVSRQEQLSEAMGKVTSRVIERIEAIKKEVASLQKESYYTTFAESFEETSAISIPEEIQNDLIDRLTIRTFNEELKDVFPYIYKFVNEDELPVVEISADDLLESDDQKVHNQVKSLLANTDPHKAIYDALSGMYGPMVQDYLSGILDTITFETGLHPDDNIDELLDKMVHELETSTFLAKPTPLGQPGTDTSKELDPEKEFESFMEQIVNEEDDLFSPNKSAQQTAIKKFNDIMSQELKPGPDGVNAIESLKGIIDNQDLVDEIRHADPDLDVRSLVQQWIYDHKDEFEDPTIINQLQFSGDETSDDTSDNTADQLGTGGMPDMSAAPDMSAVPDMSATGATPTPDMTGATPPAPDMTGATPPAPGTAPAPGTPPLSEADKSGEKSPFTKMIGAIHRAKEAGAKLETVLDFGHSKKTMEELIHECGMEPADFGYDEEPNDKKAVEKMLKFVSGFWNKDAGHQHLNEGNFTIGGTRVKIKLKKAWEEGQFGKASPEALKTVMKFIDKKDPPTDEHGQDEKIDIVRLAGVRPAMAQEVVYEQPDEEVDEAHKHKHHEHEEDRVGYLGGLGFDADDAGADMDAGDAGGDVDEDYREHDMHEILNQFNEGDDLKSALAKIRYLEEADNPFAPKADPRIAAWERLTPAQKQWMGKADPTDPITLSRLKDALSNEPDPTKPAAAPSNQTAQPAAGKPNEWDNNTTPMPDMSPVKETVGYSEEPTLVRIVSLVNHGK